MTNPAAPSSPTGSPASPGAAAGDAAAHQPSKFAAMVNRVKDVFGFAGATPATDGTEEPHGPGVVFHGHLEVQPRGSAGRWRWRWVELMADRLVVQASDSAGARVVESATDLWHGMLTVPLAEAPADAGANAPPFASYFCLYTNDECVSLRAFDDELRFRWLEALGTVQQRMPALSEARMVAIGQSVMAQQQEQVAARRSSAHGESRLGRFVNKIRRKTTNRESDEAVTGAAPIEQHKPSYSYGGEDDVFGVPIELAAERWPSAGDGNVPFVISSCVAFLREFALTLDGLFRISASQHQVEELVTVLNNVADPLRFDLCTINTVVDDPHLAAATLKLFLRLLPEPLCTYDLYDYFISAAQITDHGTRLQQLYSVVSALPEVNAACLAALMHLAHDVSTYEDLNRMSAANLSVVLSPNILRPRVESMATLGDMRWQSDIVRLMIEYSSYIFDL